MKLCCFDIDNTILPFGHRVLSPKTKEALNALLKQGDIVCLTSGRPYEGAKQYLDTLIDGKKYEIVSNGSAIYSYEGQLIYENPMHASDVYYFYEHYGHIKGVTIYAFDDQNRLVTFKKSKYHHLEERLNHMYNHVDFLHEDHRNDPIKIQKIMIASRPELSATIHLTEEEQKHYFASRSAAPFYEVLPLGSSKGAMVEKLRVYLHIPKEDVYCFGDSDNDLTMVRAYTGIAPANADEAVKKAAQYVTKSCKEDGVAYALKDILHLIK